ncbi:MAG: class I SAM-dependent RNA methyltransferase [Cypionkella sp.]|nr:class I SAM-dependent RNA methyltransferase [Cypionkella sp.]
MKLTIERLGHLGDAVATGPEGPLFLRGFLPGEQIEGDDPEAMRITTPSPNRVRPPCQHARACGGCMLQHASDDFVAGWKGEVVSSALRGQGIEARFLTQHTSPTRSRRRATFAARRTKGGVLIGFHARASDVLVDIPNCQLLLPEILAALPQLEPLVRLGATRVAAISIQITATASGLDVAVADGKDLDAQSQMELARLCETAGLARLTWNGEIVAMRHAPMLRMGRALVAPPPNAFLQATAQGEGALLAAVRHITKPARRIVDLFAGLGTFALPLAERADLLAVEGDAKMLAALSHGARNTEGLHKVDTEARDLFRRPLEPDEFKGIDAVVIDPPRAGAEAQMRTLAASAVPLIAAVSCNPVTFARDAKILLAGGYRLDFVQVVDQFRWSHHVELVAGFSRA